jgi:hypothetical protein
VPNGVRHQALLDRLEINAKRMADSLDYISGGLRVNLHALSAISKQCVTVVLLYLCLSIASEPARTLDHLQAVRHCRAALSLSLHCE